MLGAIIGDIIGSRFEWHNIKSKSFTLFDPSCHPTDDSVMTMAVAEAIRAAGEDMDLLKDEATSQMQAFGRKYPRAGYGGRFRAWLNEADPHPYNSFGNGAAMRVSPCGDAADSLDEAFTLAETVTNVTHNHPEAIRAARIIAGSIYLLRHGSSKEDVRAFATASGYDLDFSLDDIRPAYEFVVRCDGSVQPAIVAFLEAEDFEDAIRNAVSIGGDSDTIAAITGSLAEAHFGIPDDLRDLAWAFLDEDQRACVTAFENTYLT